MPRRKKLRPENFEMSEAITRMLCVAVELAEDKQLAPRERAEGLKQFACLVKALPEEGLSTSGSQRDALQLLDELASRK